MQEMNSKNRITATTAEAGHLKGKEQRVRTRIRSLMLLTAHCSLLTVVCFLPSAVRAQVVVDKTVAAVNNGSLAVPDLITYSDLVWQLALQRDTPIEKPSSKDLNHALELLEDQRLILLEANKLPGAEITPEEVKQRRDEVAREFGSSAALLERMARVGLTSEQLDEILHDRIAIDKYIDFRFRAFVLITDKEITAYYDEVYGRQRNSGQIVPTLEQKRSEIEQKLTEEKIASQIDTFIDNLREHAEIIVLSPV
jgi:hypothetical protein